jgi:hypothetical protein
MLPPSGTQAREVLEDQASQIGLASLARGEGDIPGALYTVYVAFRLRFIEERGLMDAAPGAGDQWQQALADARELERHVQQRWASMIAHASV